MLLYSNMQTGVVRKRNGNAGNNAIFGRESYSAAVND